MGSEEPLPFEPEHQAFGLKTDEAPSHGIQLPALPAAPDAEAVRRPGGVWPDLDRSVFLLKARRIGFAIAATGFLLFLPSKDVGMPQTFSALLPFLARPAHPMPYDL